MPGKRYLRIISMKAQPGMGDAFVKKFRKDVASTALDLDGLRRLFLFRSEDKKDDFVVVSIWQGEDKAKKYVKSGKNKAYVNKLSEVQKGRERVRGFYLELDVEGRKYRKKRSN